MSQRIAPYLPLPIVTRAQDGRFELRSEETEGGIGSQAGGRAGSKSIGRLRGFQGNYGCFVRSYAYICSLGAEGLKDASETAVLNANYLLARLKQHGVAEYLPLAYGRLCLHEFVLSGGPMKRELGLKTLDLAKRLLDYGFHPPTVYFPLLVDEALMVEPTETETRRRSTRSPMRSPRFCARRRRTRRSLETLLTRRPCGAWTRWPPRRTR